MRLRSVCTVGLATAMLMGGGLAAATSASAGEHDIFYNRQYDYVHGIYEGRSTFHSYGERLYVCDENADGHTITGWITDRSGNLIGHKVSDPDGKGGDCGYENFSLTEGKLLYLWSDWNGYYKYIDAHA